jgi:hypothetical protein
LNDRIQEVRRRLTQGTKRTEKDLPQLEAQAHKLRAQIANIVDVIAETPKAKTEALIAGLSERQDELNALDARIRAIKAEALSQISHAPPSEGVVSNSASPLRTLCSLKAIESKA